MSDKDQDLQLAFSSDRVLIYKLGRIESLLEEVKDNQEKHSIADAVFHADIEKRTSSLERTRAYAFGIIAAMTFIGTIITNFLSHYIGMPRA